MNNWMTFGGVGVAIAMIASCWGQVRTICTQLLSYVIVTYEVAGVGSHAALMHLRENYVESKFGIRTFYAFQAFVRPRQRFEWVGSEFLGGGMQLFWRGWRPIWVGRKPNEHQKDSEARMHAPLCITCLRGTIDITAFMVAAIEHFNTYDDDEDTKRYRIRHITGTAGKSMLVQQGDTMPIGGVRDKNLDCEYRAHKLLKWNHNDLGPDTRHNGRSIERLALSPQAIAAIELIRVWRKSQDWHRERGIPWKHGFLLQGPPGNGKTALIRAVAEDFDMPVYVFDLATLHNDEMRAGWTDMLCHTPCIALMEDFDAVFAGRTNIAGKLSFDCVLNCMDGIDNTDGLLVFITTNHPDKLDPAIGGGGCTRPGRIDQIVTMIAPDASGREHIANRIMADCDQCERDEVVDAGAGDSGAQFEHRCRTRALELHYESTANLAG